MNSIGSRLLALGFSVSVLPTLGASPSLVVVQDLGGVSASPYYRMLNPQSDTSPPLEDRAPPRSATPGTRYSEADLLPVRSARLTPGTVKARAIHSPGLTPLFLIGDDTRSREWLHDHVEALRAIRAVGFVVRVESREALESLRRLAPGVTLSPSSGDDLARRLDIQHYPVLITATRLEQ